MRKGSVISRIHTFFNWVAEESDLPLEEMTEEELYDFDWSKLKNEEVRFQKYDYNK